MIAGGAEGEWRNTCNQAETGEVLGGWQQGW